MAETEEDSNLILTVEAPVFGPAGPQNALMLPGNSDRYVPAKKDGEGWIPHRLHLTFDKLPKVMGTVNGQVLGFLFGIGKDCDVLLEKGDKSVCYFDNMGCRAKCSKRKRSG
jgi:hypothetical protein